MTAVEYINGEFQIWLGDPELCGDYEPGDMVTFNLREVEGLPSSLIEDKIVEATIGEEADDGDDMFALIIT